MKKATKHLIPLLMVVTLLFAQGVQAHSIEYLGVTYQGGNTILEYKITSGSSPSLSHWSLQLCDGITANDIISGTGTWEYVTSENQHEIFDGVKFDDGYNDGEMRTVTLTLAGEWAIGEVGVRFKGGQLYENATVEGPICEEPEESLAPIIPIVICVQEIGDGQLEVEFGYYNPNPCEVSVGDDLTSEVSPSSYVNNFPTTFAPYQAGQTCDDDPLQGPVPSVENYNGPTFKVVMDENDELEWVLTTGDNDPESVVVDEQTPLCEKEESLLPIVPIILCVAEVDENQLQFQIGYYNPNPCAVSVGDGVSSVVAPAGYQGDFPTTFQSYIPGGECEDDPHEGPVPTADNYNGPPPFYVTINNNEVLTWTITVDDSVRSVTGDGDTELCGGVFGDLLPVVPFLLCIQDLGNGNSQVQFGYYNPNLCPITVSFGANNLISPSQYESEFPETFEPYLPGFCNNVNINSGSLNKSLTISALNDVPDPENYNGPIVELVVPTGTLLSWDVTVENVQESAVAETNEPICLNADYYCVSGLVLMDGEPVENAVVRLEKDNQKTVKHYTDENGYYEFEKVTGGVYNLLVQGYPNLTEQVVVDGSEGQCHNREIDLGGCRELFAFYQPWFASATNPDSLRHWIPTNLGSVTDSSFFETYDSNDPDIWEYHILEAWASDIDAFIVDWYGKDEYENAPLQGLLDAAQELYEKFGSYGFDFRIIVLYNEASTGSLEDNLAYLTENVFDHPAYYGVRENEERPIFVYSPLQHLSPQVFRMTADNVVTQEALYAWNWDPTIVDLADYVNTIYPWVGNVQIDPDPLNGLVWGNEFLDTFYAGNQQFDFLTGSMWPGYDDRAYVQGQDFHIDKQDSLVYEWTWDKAHENQPYWLVLTSFNDFNRGTHVEPSTANDLFFVEKTQDEALVWKGTCARNLGELALQVPPELYNGRKTPLPLARLESALLAFFQGKYEFALSLLTNQVQMDAQPDNSLSFVTGSDYFAKGNIQWSWDKAVDGNFSSDGVALVRGDAGDPKGTAWAVYEFADKTMYKFNYVVLTTDDGSAKLNQADQFEVWVSTTTNDMSEFNKVGKFYRKGNGETQWYGLGKYVTAKYVMLKVLSPYHYSGGYRQLVEFSLDTENKMGAVQAIEEENAVTLAPIEYTLHQNYPNPFNPTTTIAFELPKADHVQMNIYNMTGQMVRTLVNKNYQAGQYSIMWDALNDSGQQVPSGLYIYRMQTQNQIFTQKMILLK